MSDEQVIIICAMILYSQLCTSEKYGTLKACLDAARELLKEVRKP